MITSPARWGSVAGTAVLVAVVWYGTGFGLDGPPEVERVSVSSGGDEAVGASTAPSVSDGGGYVAFSSDAANLVPDDSGLYRDVFVHDRRTGGVERASVSSAGVEGNGGSGSLVGLGTSRVDGSGRYVVYASDASNLVPGDVNESSDIFVRDLVADATERVSVASDGTPGSGDSIGPDISADGRFVTFASLAGNLVTSDDNGTWDVFIHDRETGATELISQATDGTPGDASSGWFGAGPPRISADGRYVVFGSVAGNLAPGDENDRDDIFVRDRDEGTTERVSVRTDGGEASEHSTYGDVSDDGRYVVFSSRADDLIDGDTNGASDIFLHRTEGTTIRISEPPGGEANGGSRFPSISGDGAHIVFQSDASNLVPGDDNDQSDVFRYTIATGALERISVPDAGGEADGASQRPDVSADGSVVVFQSTATDLVADDDNGVSDIFAWGKSIFDPDAPTATPPPTATPAALPCPERGDINGDGLTNSLDALFVLQFVAGLLDALPDVDRADVNGDGVVSAVDATLMLQYDAALLECLP